MQNKPKTSKYVKKTSYLYCCSHDSDLYITGHVIVQMHKVMKHGYLDNILKKQQSRCIQKKVYKNHA